MAFTMAASLCSVCFNKKFTPAQLQELLQSHCNRPLQLKLNENRSTMCSIRWEPSGAKISLNRIFLAAPKKVIYALAKAIEERDLTIPACVKSFIYQQLKDVDYSEQLDLSRLEHQGRVYNLKTLYESVNRDYFDDKVELAITWFNPPLKKNKSQINLGLYFDTLKLIKINRMMDVEKFPEYVVKFVIYHEMLHFVSPAYVDEAGIQRAHNKDFKNLEMQFKEFSQAKQWIQKHQLDLFDDSFR